MSSSASDFKSTDDLYSIQAKSEDDDDNDDLDMEELGRALFEAANLASKSVKDVKEDNGTTAKPLSLKPKSRRVDPNTLGKIFIALGLGFFRFIESPWLNSN